MAIDRDGVLERAERMRKLSKPSVVPFSGQGRRVDGKTLPSSGVSGKAKSNTMVGNSSLPKSSPTLKRDLSKFKKKNKGKISGVWGDNGRSLK